MYVLFWSKSIRAFVLRPARSPASFEPPDGDEAYELIDDSVAGFLDAVALVKRHADAAGWRAWDLMVEDG
jgi:hypothetical protein